MENQYVVANFWYDGGLPQINECMGTPVTVPASSHYNSFWHFLFHEDTCMTFAVPLSGATGNL